MLSESNTFSLNLLNIIVALIYIIYCFNRMMSRKSILLLPISSSAFVLSNFLLIGFLPYIAGEEYNAYDTLIKSSVGGLIFIFICLSVQLLYDATFKIILKKGINTSHNIVWSYSATYFLYIFIIIIIFGFIRFVFLSGGVNYIGAILLASGDSYKHNVVRLELGKLSNSLPGAGLAGMSIQYISPSLVSCLLIVLLRSPKRKKLSFKIRVCMLIMLLTLTSIILAMIFAKKAILIYAFIFPFIIFTFSQKFTFSFSSYRINSRQKKNKLNSFSSSGKNTNRSKPIKKNKLKNFFSTFIILLVILVTVSFTYSVSQGSSSDETSFLFLQRIFVVPAQTAYAYYSLFPYVFPFRGIENMFSFSGDISYTDISLAFTGYTSVATANFTAISYSAGGFFAVILASLTYSILTLTHDFFLEKQETIWKVFILIASINGIYSICSTPLVGSIINFGYLLPIMIFSLCLKKRSVQIN